MSSTGICFFLRFLSRIPRVCFGHAPINFEHATKYVCCFFQFIKFSCIERVVLREGVIRLHLTQYDDVFATEPVLLAIISSSVDLTASTPSTRTLAYVSLRGPVDSHGQTKDIKESDIGMCCDMCNYAQIDEKARLFTNKNSNFSTRKITWSLPRSSELICNGL